MKKMIKHINVLKKKVLQILRKKYVPTYIPKVYKL